MAYQQSKNCLYCGVEFTGHGSRKYCSPPCSWRKSNRKNIKWPSDSTMKERSLWSKYKVYVDEYDAIMSQPCEICGAESKHMDHDHSTGKIRGALCAKHNIAVGVFEDEDAYKVVAYLRRWK